MLFGRSVEVAKYSCSMNSLGEFEAILAALRQSDCVWLAGGGVLSRKKVLRSVKIF